MQGIAATRPAFSHLYTKDEVQTTTWRLEKNQKQADGHTETQFGHCSKSETYSYYLTQ